MEQAFTSDRLLEFSEKAHIPDCIWVAPRTRLEIELGTIRSLDAEVLGRGGIVEPTLIEKVRL